MASRVMGGLLGHLISPWSWRMAWRDSRTSRGKLALFSSSIVLGIAALAAIGSLGRNLERAIEEQAKSLLGADLAIHSRDAFSPEQEQWLEKLGGKQSREVSFSSMIYLPRTGSTRLVQVRALSGGFPFYGNLQTIPPEAAESFRNSGGALVEESLLRQFNAQVGDELRVGNLTMRIAGRLEKVPGETVALSAIAPRVYISLAELARTGLAQETSLARYSAYFKFPEGTDMTRVRSELRPKLEQFRMRAETVDERKRDLGRAMDNLYHFLNLVGFVALLLGSVGVASAIHSHVKQKLATAAILRCLGGSVSQTFAIYLVQGMALGAFGAVAGGALGVAIQGVIPKVIADFIPFTFAFHTAWMAVGRAVVIGFAVCLMFTLQPLLTVRRVSPLAAFRVSYEPASARADPLNWLLGACLAAGVLVFAIRQNRHWQTGVAFALGLGVTFAVLAAVAKVLMRMARLFAGTRMPYTLRQGVANLHRPNNRTLLLLLSIGLGTFLMGTLYLVHRSLLNYMATVTGKTQPNAVLFDIQNPQKEAVLSLVRSLDLPVLDTTPVVAMRLQSVKGRPVESIVADERPGRAHRWAYRREYRSTYRGELRNGEKIIAGTWVPRVGAETRPVPVSLEAGIARELQVGLGDELVFDVQGVPITTRVASLREVEWRRIQPNFFVVFPRGVLETAPAMNVIVTRVPSSEASARLQREVVRAFPNVSVIDLTLVLQTVDSIVGKIGFVVRFLAMFTVLTGFLVLVTALMTGRYQRIRESVLLRTLGASRAQVIRILLVEYFALGLLGSLTGLSLATAAAWALTKFLFHTAFVPDPIPLAGALLFVPALTVATGFLLSRGVLKQPPLVILRSEG